MKERYIVERHLYSNVYEIVHEDCSGRMLGIYKGYYNMDSHYFKIFPQKIIDKNANAKARVISGFKTEKRKINDSE